MSRRDKISVVKIAYTNINAVGMIYLKFNWLKNISFIIINIKCFQEFLVFFNKTLFLVMSFLVINILNNIWVL